MTDCIHTECQISLSSISHFALGHTGEVSRVLHEELTVSDMCSALGGSKHVEYLLRKGLINPTPSDVLQRIYDTGEVPKARLDELKKISRESTDLDTRQWLVMETLIHSAGATSTKADQAHSEHERILVSKGAGKLISFYFDLPQVEIEIERAVAQVQRAMASEQKRQSEKHGTTAEEPEKREPKP